MTVRHIGRRFGTRAFAARLVAAVVVSACAAASAQAPPAPAAPVAADPAAQAFEWNPRSGDAWIDRQLADINRYAGRYRGAFLDELVRYRAAPRALVTELVVERRWAPGDVYYACAVAQVVGRPCRAVVEVWAQRHADGWAEVAKSLGTASKPVTDARIRDGIEASFARWGRPLATEAATPATPAANARTKAKSRPAGRR